MQRGQAQHLEEAPQFLGRERQHTRREEESIPNPAPDPEPPKSETNVSTDPTNPVQQAQTELMQLQAQLQLTREQRMEQRGQALQEEADHYAGKYRRAQEELSTIRGDHERELRSLETRLREANQQAIEHREARIENLRQEVQRLQLENTKMELRAELAGPEAQSTAQQLIKMFRENGPDVVQAVIGAIQASKAGGGQSPREMQQLIAAASQQQLMSQPTQEHLQGRAVAANLAQKPASGDGQADAEEPQLTIPTDYTRPGPDDKGPEPADAPAQLQIDTGDVVVDLVLEEAVSHLGQPVVDKAALGHSVKAILDEAESGGYQINPNFFSTIAGHLIPHAVSEQAAPERVAELLTVFTADVPGWLILTIKTSPARVVKGMMDNFVRVEGADDYVLSVIRELQARI